MKHTTVSIIGGGIAGLTTAISLKKIGIEAQVFEASEQILPVGAGLGLGGNAMLALRELGIYSDVVASGRAISSFSILDSCGAVITKTDFDNSLDIENFTIHRASLQEVLLSKINPDNIHLGKKIKKLEVTDFGVKLQFEDGSSHISNYLVVADGIHSVVRQQLLPNARLRYAGYTCWRAIVDNNSLGITDSTETWGPDGRFGLVPLSNNKLYWFACVNARFSDPVFNAYNVSDLCQHFEKYHTPIADVLHHTDNCSLLHNDVIDLDPLTQFAFGRIVLIGDAAHASTPNMGQGACQAIEDAVVLGKCMARYADFEEAFRVFEQRRIPRTRWVTNTSLELGTIAQIQNKYLIPLRNTALKYLPASIKNKQIRKINSVDFN